VINELKLVLVSNNPVTHVLYIFLKSCDALISQDLTRSHIIFRGPEIWKYDIYIWQMFYQTKERK